MLACSYDHPNADGFISIILIVNACVPVGNTPALPKVMDGVVFICASIRTSKAIIATVTLVPLLKLVPATLTPVLPAKDGGVKATPPDPAH